jgi:peptide/nickel transport system permease protein
MPGDPISAIVATTVEGLTDLSAVRAIEQQYIEQFGLDRPVHMQFFIYVRNIFRGDLGSSFAQNGRPVTTILRESVGWTIALQVPAILLGWTLGNILGAVAAYTRKSFDKGVMPLFMFISNMPAFGMAIIMLWVFALRLRIAPLAGGYGFDMVPSATWEFYRSVLHHYQLPFWTIVLIAIGGQSIGMRSMSIYELNADYVRYSRFLGIRDRSIIRYVFRNAMLPQITGLAMALGTMIGGNIVAETIFSYPGIGTTLLSAIRGRDYPLISGCTLVITVMVLLANLVLELLYGLIDPRIKASQQDA